MVTIGGVSCEPVKIPGSAFSGWVDLVNVAVTLRWWWAKLRSERTILTLNRRQIVFIPWRMRFSRASLFRRVADSFAARWDSVLAFPLIARTAAKWLSAAEKFAVWFPLVGRAITEN